MQIAGNYNATSSLGLFSAFSGMSYEWYRSATSTNDPRQMPALRILLDADGNLATTGDRGGLVFERVYNEGTNQSAAPTNTWTGETIGAGSIVWNFGLGIAGQSDINNSGYSYDETLTQWKAFFPNAAIIGFSSGIGSGWGPFEGAVDNISWTIGGATTTSNFERVGVAAVPEPETLSRFAAALVALGPTARRRRAC